MGESGARMTSGYEQLGQSSVIPEYDVCWHFFLASREGSDEMRSKKSVRAVIDCPSFAEPCH